MSELAKAWRKLASDRKGVTALEYALIAGLIAAVIVGAVTTLGTNVGNQFTTLAGAF